MVPGGLWLIWIVGTLLGSAGFLSQLPKSIAIKPIEMIIRIALLIPFKIVVFIFAPLFSQ